MARTRQKCLNCGAPFLKAVEREPICTHCGAERIRPQGLPLQPGWKEVNPTPRPQAQGPVLGIIVVSVLFMTCIGGGVAFFALADSKPRPARVAERPGPPPAVIFPVPPPPPIVTQPPPPPPEIIMPPPVKPTPRPLPKTNEAWGAVMLSKHLRDYDYCGKEAILRDGSIPRIFRLRARFDAKGEGVKGKLTPTPSVAMLNACIENRTKYIYLGKPPEQREFAVEMTLSFAHLRPKGKPETRDDQWGALGDD
ncbi:hypothetical protein [Myxococcus qinghaiensis]|uniref:hypothetical protein n=1 Tax=Myxococcus qinghaiensis TaxID=2906758 RepID=UPI0020A7E80D|nr:hypothetical protein [Myxococcus qinghaiensis]MCP3165749.1 hypothetical protein [Myxococcus qinghaiensis]